MQSPGGDSQEVASAARPISISSAISQQEAGEYLLRRHGPSFVEDREGKGTRGRTREDMTRDPRKV